MPKNITLPTLEQAKAALHRFIDEHLAIREYNGNKFFGTPFQGEDGADVMISITDGVEGMPKISLGRLRPSAAVSAATKVSRAMTDENIEALSQEQRQALAEKLLASLK